jgi:hypothetical protein
MVDITANMVAVFDLEYIVNINIDISKLMANTHPINLLKTDSGF